MNQDQLKDDEKADLALLARYLALPLVVEILTDHSARRFRERGGEFSMAQVAHLEAILGTPAFEMPSAPEKVLKTKRGQGARLARDLVAEVKSPSAPLVKGEAVKRPAPPATWEEERMRRALAEPEEREAGWWAAVMREE